MRAPVQKLIRRPSRSIPSIILALLLLTAGGLGAWLLGHRIVSGTWPDRAVTTLDAVGSTTLGSVAVLVTAGIVAVCGLVMILSALWPGLPERIEILPDAVPGQTAVTRRDLAGLVRTQVEQVDGVHSATVKSLGVVFFRSGGDGGQGGATVDAVGAVVGVEHVGQVSQGGLGEVAAFAVLPLLVALAGRSRSGG